MDSIVILTMPYQYIFLHVFLVYCSRQRNVCCSKKYYLFIHLFPMNIGFFSSRKVPLILIEKWFIVTPLQYSLKNLGNSVNKI